MPETIPALRRTLTLGPAIWMAITLVVGSGSLVLPGLAYERLGDQAVYSWLAAALISVPLLVVLGSLGARYPGAGGIAGFVEPALGARGSRVADMILLGAVPGGAGLALIGGHAVADLGHRAGLASPVAIGFVVLAGVANLFGLKAVGSVQAVLSTAFVVTLLAVVVAGFAADRAGVGMAAPSDAGGIASGVQLVFFAFVGWELMAFASEEFVNPRRDFPRMIVCSFAGVAVLYLLLAAAVQLALPLDAPRLTTNPLATLAERGFGTAGDEVVAGIGLVIVLANVNGVVMAFSRLVYSAARAGTLPAPLRALDRNGTPRRAIVAVALTFAGFVLLEHTGALSQARLLEVAGTSFFAAFVLAAIAYRQESTTRRRRAFGTGTVALGLAVLSTFGIVVAVPVLLAGVALVRTRGGRGA